MPSINRDHFDDSRQRLNACPCPWCAPPSREPVRLGDALPDVLAEMRRREGKP